MNWTQPGLCLWARAPKPGPKKQKTKTFLTFTKHTWRCVILTRTKLPFTHSVTEILQKIAVQGLAMNYTRMAHESWRDAETSLYKASKQSRMQWRQREKNCVCAQRKRTVNADANGESRTHKGKVTFALGTVAVACTRTGQTSSNALSEHPC